MTVARPYDSAVYRSRGLPKRIDPAQCTAPALIRGAFEVFGGVIAKTPEQGAATQTYVMTSQLLDGVNGAYFEDCNPVTVSGDNHLFDTAMAARLWNVAQQMTAEYLV